MTSKQKDILKYVVVSFLPVSVYAFILLITPVKLSFFFHLIFMIVIGFISQVAFKIYLERNND